MMRAVLNYTAGSTDSLLKKRVHKLRFTVLHITNSPVGSAAVEKVSPIQNDLMAPILTITGAYDMQTTVNDNRLTNFLNDINNDKICQGTDCYNIDLYKSKDERNAERKQGIKKTEPPYAMNWFISDTTRTRMDNRLSSQPVLNMLINKLVSPAH